MGPGCFVKGLEYSAQCTAEVVGKPNRSFFISALGSIAPENALMIGDVSSMTAIYTVISMNHKKLKLSYIYLIFTEYFSMVENNVNNNIVKILNHLRLIIDIAR